MIRGREKIRENEQISFSMLQSIKIEPFESYQAVGRLMIFFSHSLVILPNDPTTIITERFPS